MIFCFLIVFSSCHRSSKTKIGFMLPTFEVSRYFIDRDNFVAKANELGVETLVADANNDDDKQIDQAIELMDKGAKVLVVMPVNLNTAAAIVRYAHARNVKVIAYCRIIQNSDLDYFIAYDDRMIGQQMAKYTTQYKAEGNYVVINGDKTDKSAVLTKVGQMDVLAPFIKSGKIKVVHNIFVEDWSPDEAYFTMKRVIELSGESIDVVLSGNDGMAGGIIKALEEYNLSGKVLVTGLDADLAACKRIVQGKQSMTVYMPIKQQAMFAASVAVKLINGENIESTTTTFNRQVNVPTIVYQTVAVDKNNMKNSIIADGFYKESDVYAD